MTKRRIERPSLFTEQQRRDIKNLINKKANLLESGYRGYIVRLNPPVFTGGFVRL